MSNKDPYEILQVRQDAEKEVIDAAYRGLARKYHPDMNKSSDATHKMQEINRAYEILGNDISRQKWDRGHNPTSRRYSQVDEERRSAEEVIRQQKARAEEEQQKKKQEDENRRKAEEELIQKRAQAEAASRKAEEEIRQQKAHVEAEQIKKKQDEYQRQKINVESENSKEVINFKSLIIVVISILVLYLIIFRLNPMFEGGVIENPTTFPATSTTLPVQRIQFDEIRTATSAPQPQFQFHKNISNQEIIEKEGLFDSFVDRLRNLGYFNYQNGHYQYLGDLQMTNELTSWESLDDSASSFIVQGKVSWDSTETNPKNIGCGFAIREYENDNFNGYGILAFIARSYDISLIKQGKSDPTKEFEFSPLANAPGKTGAGYYDQPVWRKNQPVKFTLVSLGTKVFVFLDDKEKISKLLTQNFKGRPSTLLLTEKLSKNNTCNFKDIELYIFEERP